MTPREIASATRASKIGPGKALVIGLLIVAACPHILLAAWFLQTVHTAATSSVPIWARDLNCDGHVSISEWYTGGLDHGWRPATDGSGCMEVFAFKDGMPEVIWCEASPRCRIAPWLLLKRSRRKKLDSSDERGL